MKIKHFYLGLNSDDFVDGDVPGGIVADFNFQTDYFTHFVEKKMKNKFEHEDFNFIYIRLRKNPKNVFSIDKIFKCLTIEIPFYENRYKEIFPIANEYPLKGCLKPITKEKAFNDFLFDLHIEALLKAKEQGAPIPYDFLINTVLDFKLNGFKNEWIYKNKSFKEFALKTMLICKLTCNYFSLELILVKNKREIFRKEILKTLPNSIIYKSEFKDIILEKNVLKVLKDDVEKSVLYEISIQKFI